SNPSQIMAPLDQRSLAMPKSGPQSPVSKPVFIASYVSPPNSTTALITISPVSSTAGSPTSTVHFHASLSVIRALSASKRPISSLTTSELLNQSQALPAVSTTHSQPSAIRLLTAVRASASQGRFSSIHAQAFPARFIVQSQALDSHPLTSSTFSVQVDSVSQLQALPAMSTNQSQPDVSQPLSPSTFSAAV